MKRCLGLGVGALLLAACQAPLRPPLPAAQAPTPGAATQAPAAAQSVADLAAAVQADARRADRESDANARTRLADAAGRDADACLARAPQAGACLYSRALALGLAARTHPVQAGELLKRMLEALSAADAADPEYDDAGPARVRALVLTRSPGWPLGPGDPQAISCWRCRRRTIGTIGCATRSADYSRSMLNENRTAGSQLHVAGRAGTDRLDTRAHRARGR